MGSAHGPRKDFAVESGQVRNFSVTNMKHASGRGHNASPQCGLSAGCKRHPSSKKLGGLSVRATYPNSI